MTLGRRAIGVAGLVVCAGAIALPGLASGGSKGDYVGKVKGAESSEITFDVIRKPSGKLGVHEFTIKDAPTTCSSVSDDTTSYALGGWFSLSVSENGRFHVRDSPSGFRDKSLIVIKGKLRRHGRASGWLRVVDDFDVVGVCDTGRLDWAASK